MIKIIIILFANTIRQFFKIQKCQPINVVDTVVVVVVVGVSEQHLASKGNPFGQFPQNNPSLQSLSSSQPPWPFPHFI